MLLTSCSLDSLEHCPKKSSKWVYNEKPCAENSEACHTRNKIFTHCKNKSLRKRFQSSDSSFVGEKKLNFKHYLPLKRHYYSLLKFRNEIRLARKRRAHASQNDPAMTHKCKYTRQRLQIFLPGRTPVLHRRGADVARFLKSPLAVYRLSLQAGVKSSRESGNRWRVRVRTEKFLRKDTQGG